MSKEKGILPGVFWSSIVTPRVTVFVCLLTRSNIFNRFIRLWCAENAFVWFFDRKNKLLLGNLRVHSYQSQSKKNSRGVTLIEVLVTLVVLSIGLLGMAAMQVRALQMNQSAYMRSQAVSLSQDMADRMRINWEAAKEDGYELTLAAISKDFSEAGGDSDQIKLARTDIQDWLDFIQISLPSGDGRIVKTGDRFTITICWDDSRGQGAQQSQAACDSDGLESNEIEVML